MAWYWIALIVAVYLFGIGISAAIFDDGDMDSKATGVAVGLIWPLWLVSYLGYKFVKFLEEKKL